MVWVVPVVWVSAWLTELEYESKPSSPPTTSVEELAYVWPDLADEGHGCVSARARARVQVCLT